jgi:hypothetical protein
MSHRKMCGVPLMDNADGQVLETGLIRGNSRLPTKRKAAFLGEWRPVAGNRLAAPGTRAGS